MCFGFLVVKNLTKAWIHILIQWIQNKTAYRCVVMAGNFLNLFKGSRQPESRGVRNVSIWPNLSGTAAIDVLFSINFAVVFDIMYFRFRPSKAKWLGDVLTNGQNAANTCSVSFFEVILLATKPKCCGSGSPPQHCPPLHIWIAASILKTERYSLRHYTDATTHLAPLGNAQQYCSVYNFQLVFRGFFLQLAARCLRTQTDSVRQ